MTDLGLAKRGTWTVVLVVDPEKTDVLPDRAFLDVLDRSNPDYTGWPIWMDTRSFRDEEARPRVVDGAWEAVVSGDSGGVDYMRLDPRGKFVLVRTLQDDTTDKVPPGTAFDPVLAILRVAEAIAVGLAFVKALGWELDATKLGFTFEWRSLRGREIKAWAGPGIRFLSGGGKAYDDEAHSFVEVPAGTPVTAIAPFVDQATRPLFVCFEGFTYSRQSIEKWVSRLIERKL